jgi:hypothetical protein
MNDERERGRPRKYDYIPNSELFQKPVWWIVKQYGITDRRVYEIRQNRKNRGDADDVLHDLYTMTPEAFQKKYQASKAIIHHEWRE